MSTRTYNYIVHTCIVVGVGSAFLFERAGRFHWLIGSVAILAGIVAGIAFFQDRFSGEKSEEVLRSEQVTALIADSGIGSLQTVALQDTRGVVGQLSLFPDDWVISHSNSIFAWAEHYYRESYVFPKVRSYRRGTIGLYLRPIEAHQFDDRVRKLYFLGSDVELELVSTKQEGEPTITFVVRNQSASRRPYREVFQDLVSDAESSEPTWIDATSSLAS